ncbi:MAG TPA: hypothetical protein DCR71_04780 [Dehalococcoidia bacterium]|nr:hypothetical protein [Dehalococcoidia bacterium]HAS27778.1 hypothetical protein [Dehalococcoidia bacterium]
MCCPIKLFDHILALTYTIISPCCILNIQKYTGMQNCVNIILEFIVSGKQYKQIFLYTVKQMYN